jgi:DNA-binding transcriptional LysR family regulator
MNLRQLEVFCRIVDLGSFSMAAEDVGLSQPAVTFQMQALEKELGATLLDRSARRVLPTDSGRILYDHAREILRHADQVRRQLDELESLSRGTLLIGASTGPGEHILPQILGRFKAAHPQIDVVLRILPTHRIIEQVLSYELEVGIVGAKEKNPKLHFESFVDDRLIVITPPDHPWATRDTISMEELLREPFILQQPGAGVRIMLESGLKEIGLDLSDLNIYMELGLQESIKTAVKAGFGVAIISRFAGRQELSFGTLAAVEIRDLPVFRDVFYLVRHRGRTLSRLTEAFLLFAKEYFASETL